VVYVQVGEQSHEVFYGLLWNSKVGQNCCNNLRIRVSLFCSGACLWSLHLNAHPTCRNVGPFLLQIQASAVQCEWTRR
jgi:hypothetical protein